MRNAAKIKFTIPANAGISARKTPEKKVHPIPAKRPKKKHIPFRQNDRKKVHPIPANAGISAEIPIYIGMEAGRTQNAFNLGKAIFFRKIQSGFSVIIRRIRIRSADKGIFRTNSIVLRTNNTVFHSNSANGRAIHTVFRCPPLILRHFPLVPPPTKWF